MQRKKTKVWIILLLLPIFFFALSIVLGLRSQANSTPAQNCLSPGLTSTQVQHCINKSNTGSVANKGSSVGAVVSGGLAVLSLLGGTPIWIVFLVKARNYNKKLNATALRSSQGQSPLQTAAPNSYPYTSSPYPVPNTQPPQVPGHNDDRPPTNSGPVV